MAYSTGEPLPVGGISLIPAVRAIFARRFGADRIDGGGGLTSIATASRW